MSSLDSLGIEYNLKQSSLKDDYLSFYEREISYRLPNSFTLLIITNEKIEDVASVYSKKYPLSKIIVASYGYESYTTSFLDNVVFHAFINLDALINQISLIYFDAVIEHSSNRKSHKLKLFKKLFFRLPKGGVYFIQELHAKFISGLIDCDGPDILDLINEVSQLKISNNDRRKNADPYAVALAECCESIFIKSKLGVLVKGKASFKSLRSNEAKNMINSGSLKGSIIVSNDNEFEFVHSITSVITPTGEPWRNPAKFKIPESFLAKYQSVHCDVGQIAYMDGYLLPDSFRMQHHKKLTNRNIISLVADICLLKDEKPDPIHLAGEYFYLDSEYPGHFGHFTSEVVSRLWAWEEIKTRSPNAKVLIGLEKGKSLPSFIETILSCYHISRNEIQTFDSSITVDVLYAATPYYAIGNHINPKIKDVWERIGESTNDGISGIIGNRLFISRPEGGERKCLNAEKLERIFFERGFEFYNPEKYSWKDQVKTFSSADVIAGYAGSGTFNTMFAKGSKKIFIIGSDSYTATNEHYICAIKGYDLNYYLGDSLVKHGNVFSLKAFKSDYNFNYERDEESLIDALSKI
ncbi:glycosyltransferase family 61 protein (plasmid) [Citrobacter freundii]|uniref:glycosyltransferase family 61 protein n=1 Tax=Citrobacter freundii TaxID=546 RepID=UPI002248B31B|nr:glycosyltransferase family 61 protein [Citrobacter freundii]UZQ87348.1 glycosyltransferase family 61 protein [Citrobacter freundii]UZQ97902.1 glycosyltransferase family 61 protein [Citrobacter freundii]